MVTYLKRADDELYAILCHVQLNIKSFIECRHMLIGLNWSLFHLMNFMIIVSMVTYLKDAHDKHYASPCHLQLNIKSFIDFRHVFI